MNNNKKQHIKTIENMNEHYQKHVKRIEQINGKWWNASKKPIKHKWNMMKNK